MGRMNNYQFNMKIPKKKCQCILWMFGKSKNMFMFSMFSIIKCMFLSRFMIKTSSIISIESHIFLKVSVLTMDILYTER